MRRYILAFLLGLTLMLGVKGLAFAQNTRVVADCANTGLTWTAGDIGRPILLDTNGRPCTDSLDDYPVGAVPITNTASGTTGATAATLAAAAGKTTYICGFHVSGSATAAITVALTIGGVVSGTMNFQHGIPVTAAGVVSSFTLPFFPCVPGSAANTAIVVTLGAAGTGGVTRVNAWGYQK